MAEERKSITLHIGQQPFKLVVPSNEEGLYRQAESRIQKYMQYMAENNRIADRFTQLGFAAINSALNEICFENRQAFVDSDLKNNLRKIQEDIQLVLKDSNEIAY